MFGGGSVVLLLPTPPQPPISSSTSTVVSVAPRTKRRFRGTAANTKIPRTAAQSAASNQNAPGPLIFGVAGAIGTIFARDEVSRLAGTVTVNDVLVPPANCGSAVLTPLLAPVDCGVQITSEFGLKFEPLTVSVILAPVLAVVGEIEVSVGTGPSILKFTDCCAPVTVTAATEGFASAVAGTVTVT